MREQLFSDYMAACSTGSVKASQQMITAMPEIREQELQEDDEFLILACDGIWENMSSQQVRLPVGPVSNRGV